MIRSAGTRLQREIRKQLRELAPNIPLSDFLAVEDIAARGHLRHLPPSIIAWQALTTHVRHTCTDYDLLIEEGYDRDAARYFVLESMNDILSLWGCLKRVEAE